MKDYEALSRKHFDGQAAQYDARDTVYYSREGKISCRDIAALLKDRAYEKLMRQCGFEIVDSRQISGMIYTVTGKKAD